MPCDYGTYAPPPGGYPACLPCPGGVLTPSLMSDGPEDCTGPDYCSVPGVCSQDTDCVLGGPLGYSCVCKDGFRTLTGGGCLAVCGDSQLRGNETCDDGNVVSDDGCSDEVMHETIAPFIVASSFVCVCKCAPYACIFAHMFASSCAAVVPFAPLLRAGSFLLERPPLAIREDYTHCKPSNFLPAQCTVEAGFECRGDMTCPCLLGEADCCQRTYSNCLARLSDPPPVTIPMKTTKALRTRRQGGSLHCQLSAHARRGKVPWLTDNLRLGLTFE